jgi:hypothetical protein
LPDEVEVKEDEPEYGVEIVEEDEYDDFSS